MIFSIFRVSGHSMEPKFRAGQTLLVSTLPYFFREPKVGDAIVLKDKGKLLLKRIIKKDKDAFSVTGDNKGHSRTFGPVLKKSIVGKVFLRI